MTTKAYLLNAQFQSVFVKDDKKGTSLIPTGESFPANNNLNISVRGVEKLLSKLAVNKASGPDQLSNYYLRETAKQTAPILLILDFSKAFNTVPHHRLMSNLGHYGIKGDIHNWISGFLMGRSQKVVVEGVCSPEISVHSGLPKGQFLDLFYFYFL